MRTRDAAPAIFYGQQARDCACGCGGGCLGTAVVQAARDAALRSLNNSFRDAKFDESQHPRKGGKFTAGGATAEEHDAKVEKHIAKRDDHMEKSRAASDPIQKSNHKSMAQAHTELADHHAVARNNLENAGHGGSNPSGRIKIAEKAAKEIDKKHERTKGIYKV